MFLTGCLEEKGIFPAEMMAGPKAGPSIKCVAGKAQEQVQAVGGGSAQSTLQEICAAGRLRGASYLGGPGPALWFQGSSRIMQT